MKRQNIVENLRGEQGGFTLIELIVVMAVFLFIIGAAISIFISVVQNQKKVLAEQQLINQVSYAEEYMAKALRMATADTAGNCIPKGYIYLLTPYDDSTGLFTGIKFINQSTLVCQQFLWDKNSGELEEVDWVGDTAGPEVPITSSGLTINSVRLSVNGSDGSSNFTEPSPTDSCSISQCGATDTDTVQPRVTILLNILVPGINQGVGASCGAGSGCTIGQACDLSTHRCSATTTIQTTVSQRNLNAQ